MPCPLRVALLALAAALPACRSADGDRPAAPAAERPAPDAAPPDTAWPDDAWPDAAPPDAAPPDAAPEPPLPAGRARLRFEPVAPLDMDTQLHPLYRKVGAAGSARRKGWFYLEFCSTPGCRAPRRVRVDARPFGPFGSVNGPRGDALTVGGLPGRRAPWFVRIVLDTAFSRAAGDGVEPDGEPGPFDVYASGHTGGQPRCAAPACVGGRVVDGHNPPPHTFELRLTDGQTTDLGRVVFGHIVGALDTPRPAPGDGVVLVAATGTDGRNAVYPIDARDRRVGPPAIARLGDAPYPGDLCGFVRGAGRTLWVLGASDEGGHVFRYDVARRRFARQPPLTIPPPRRGNRVSLCRGVHLEAAGRRWLVLIEFAGAGARDVAEGWPLAVVDVTDPRAPTARPIAAGVPPLDRAGASSVLRAIATDGSTVFALAPSWRSGGDGDSALYAFALDPQTGALSLRHAAPAGRADERCDSTLRTPPALAVAEMGGAPRVFVGTDAGLEIHDAAALAAGRHGAPLARLDLTDHGRLITDLAASPDGRRLYALPSCKSTRKATLGGSAANRHAVAIVDLGSAPSAPALLHADRRFDDPDGGPTGGVDLAWLGLKRAALRYAPEAVLPPIAFTGPQIVAGSTALYLRGTGVSLEPGASAEHRAAGVSGLGQAGDVAVLDLATGHGATSRPDYRLWFDGPSAMWGVDLRPGDRGAATGALIHIPR